MNSLFLIIPVVLLFSAAALAIFYWAVQNDQFEDLERHGSDILNDDSAPKRGKQP